MATNETGQERTEEATPRRREKAFEEGRIPKSQEFTGAVVILSGIAVLALGGGMNAAAGITNLTQQAADWIATGREFDAVATHILRTAVATMVGSVGPILFGVAVIALMANLIQARGVFSVTPITPNLSRISPLAGVKRIISAESFFTLVKSVVKLGLLASLAYLAFGNALPEMLALPKQDPEDVLAVMRNHTVRLTVVVGAAFLALSLLDYVFQVRKHAHLLRMTRHEVLQERKDTEGDPLIKSRVRAVAMALSQNRMMKVAATADVVVTSPNGHAVALKYDPGVAAAPTVTAIGARKSAARISAVARENGVPVVEDIPLVRALVATAKVGRPVPPALYVQVSEVLAAVYSNEGKSRHGGRGAA